MMNKSFELDINDSCWEDAYGLVPNVAGIYFVYACFQGPDGRWFSGDLVYIGEASDLKSRISQHANASDGTDNLHKGLLAIYKKLWYTYAFFDGSESDRKLCEAALIYKHKPILNVQNKDRFCSHADVGIVLRGETRKLVTNYVLPGDK